jgi:putative SOS response-associated peptidase YedK
LGWGLVPFFTKSLTEFKGFSIINARAETDLNLLQRPPAFQIRGRRGRPVRWREKVVLLVV